LPALVEHHARTIELVKALGQIGATLASIARGFAIASLAALCVVIYGGGSLCELAIRGRTARERHRARRRGRLLRWCFEQLGATFVKIGQVVSSRPDLFSDGVIAELRALQDHVPAFSYRRVRAILARELGAPIEQRFREFDRAPVAAGGIAQVHRAVLIDGAEVAVKVLRPGVRDRVRRDARLLLWLAHVVHAVSPRARAADAIGHVRSLIAGIIAQTDLRNEARSYRRFRREFTATPAVAFPCVHAQCSTSEVLVMEFIHGATMDRIRPALVPQVVHALREAFFAMCFDHGFVHADLHPGNVLVRDDGVVVLVDVGLVKYLPAGVTAQVVDFARCMAFGDARALVAHLRRHYRCPDAADWDAVARDAAELIAELRRRSMAELEVSAVVGRLFALGRKHHIRPVPELSLVLLGMVTVEGLIKRLDPGANVMTEVARFLGSRIAGERRRAETERSRNIGLLPEVSDQRSEGSAECDVPGDRRQYGLLARGSREWPRDLCVTLPSWETRSSADPSVHVQDRRVLEVHARHRRDAAPPRRDRADRVALRRGRIGLWLPQRRTAAAARPDRRAEGPGVLARGDRIPAR